MALLVSLDAAIDVIRHAFDPLACVVEVYDYDKRVRFRVFSPDHKPVDVVLNVSARDIMNSAKLHSEIRESRARVEAKGFKLWPWPPPGQ